MPTIPIPRFNDFEPEDVNSEEFLNRLIRLSRSLEFLMSHMDHDNVRQLFTEECNIQSAAGETVIKGPLLTMRAGSTTIRLKQGYDKDSTNFVFELYNSTGVKTVGIDSSGNATFTGTITGGLIRTAASGERIELTGNSMICYDSSGKRHGLVFGSSVALGTTNSFADMYLYHSGTKLCEIYDDLTGYCFRPPTTDNFVQIGKADCHTYVVGNVHHSGTGCKIGFFNTSPVAKTAVSTVASTVVDDIKNKLNELINVIQGYGLV